jgi:diguanylate cyclase (GGDEF)-like protein
MIYKGWTDPAAYDPRVEAVHFFFAVIIIVSVHVLTVRLNGLRQRLSQQKRDLQEAFERIQLLATRDELTGLLNRRAMMELLGAEARRVQRGGGPMALVLVDIDHFKAVNDTHGHSCGDKVLAGFAAQAEGALRASDVLARWGGEEFLLLMPATGVEQALVGVQRVRERLAHHAFDDVVPGLSVTFSAGLTLCLGESDLTAAIERADQALYRAKSGGRNRTECA